MGTVSLSSVTSDSAQEENEEEGDDENEDDDDETEESETEQNEPQESPKGPASMAPVTSTPLKSALPIAAGPSAAANGHSEHQAHACLGSRACIHCQGLRKEQQGSYLVPCGTMFVRLGDLIAYVAEEEAAERFEALENLIDPSDEKLIIRAGTVVTVSSRTEHWWRCEGPDGTSVWAQPSSLQGLASSGGVSGAVQATCLMAGSESARAAL